jgi:hypothetical protein
MRDEHPLSPPALHARGESGRAAQQRSEPFGFVNLLKRALEPHVLVQKVCSGCRA